MSDNGDISVKVIIGNEDYVISGGESEDAMLEMAEHVDRHVTALGKRFPTMPRHRLMVMAALNIAEELFALKREYADLINLIESEVK